METLSEGAPAVAVGFERRGEAAVVTIAYPPVNTLSAPVREGLSVGLARALADPAVRVIVITGAGQTFVSGADIREFGAPLKGIGLAAIQQQMEASSKPIVAAINGTALGGGLELALAAHYRTAVAGAKVGFPEIHLGLLPGGGGTQRATRVMGPQPALDLILSGRSLLAPEALAHGLIDCLIDGDLVEGSAAYALEMLSLTDALPRAIERTDKICDIDPTLFSELRLNNSIKWRGMVAPFKILDCIEAACRLPAAEGLEFERTQFRACMDAPSRAAQVHLFFAERSARKTGRELTGSAGRPIASAAVIGSGTMGCGIAIALANAGIVVKLLDTAQSTLDRGLERIRSTYAISRSRGSVTQEAVDAALRRITAELDYGAIAQSDLVVEAVIEDMEVKRAVFRTLDTVMKADAILGSNTSGLDIDAIAAATGRPDRVVGLHFFSPANVMRLLEVVRCRATSEPTIAAVQELAKTLGKVAVLAGNCDGFIGNRILRVYGREADFLLEEGATPWQIDQALQDFGFPMGLFLMRDMAGLDIAWQFRKKSARSRNPAHRYSPIADRICELGRFGQKTGAGYYQYDERRASPDAKIQAIIEQVSDELGIRRRNIGNDEIVERLLTAIVNEGAWCLDEGVAARASDIDLVYVHGYGFPKYRGGPMFWGERQQGLRSIYESVLRYQAKYGDTWRAAPRLQSVALEDAGWDSFKSAR